MNGKVIAINVSEKKGVVKKSVESAEFIPEHGIKGDAHAGNWHRQISLLAAESVDKMRKLGATGLENGIFAENLTVQGINLHSLPVGTLLEIGETLQEITQIGKTCHKSCEIRKIVGDCIMPREGIFTKVITGGIVKVGDDIVIRQVEK